MNPTRSQLTQLRQRLVLQAFCRGAATAGVGASAGTLAWALASPATWWPWTLVLWGIAILAAAVWAVATAPALPEVAAWIDERAGTCDRFSTLLEFEALPEKDAGFYKAAREECARFLAQFDVRPWAPWVFPKQALWMMAPLVLLALVEWGVRPMWQEPEREADATTVAMAEQLEQMAKKAEESESPEMKELAEALKKSAEQLREEAKGETPEKAMLRELSALEEAIRQAQAAANDLKELAEALAKSEATKEAAEALKEADTEAAAKGLEEKAKQMAEAGADDPATKEAMAELEKALREAAKKMREKSALAEAAAQAAQAARSQNSRALAEALSQLGQTVRQQRKGSQHSKQSMQQMLSALRDMKANRDSQGQGDSQPGDGVGRIAMMMPGNNPGQQGQMGESAGEMPGGQPGSEMDQGSKDSPYGAPAPKAESGQQSQLQGLLGEGESLHTLLPAKPGEEPAKAGYKALYEAAAPAAEDALQKEKIPIGSRPYVRRYFEAIRPKQ